MKTFVTLLAALGLAGFASDAMAADKLLHVVSFKFKASASAEDIKKVETSFKALKDKIPQIKSLEWGTNVSPEKLNKGFTHCWVLSFTGDRDRDAYLVHPAHKAFGQSLGPLLEDVFVIDFRVQE
jgi:hypothetical protein